MVEIPEGGASSGPGLTQTSRDALAYYEAYWHADYFLLTRHGFDTDKMRLKERNQSECEKASKKEMDERTDQETETFVEYGEPKPEVPCEHPEVTLVPKRRLTAQHAANVGILGDHQCVPLAKLQPSFQPQPDESPSSLKATQGWIYSVKWRMMRSPGRSARKLHLCPNII